VDTEITVQVKGDPNQILECAYRSLLSLDVSGGQNLTRMKNHINKTFMVASVALKYKFTSKRTFACLIQLKKQTENDYDLILTLDEDTISSIPRRANNIVLMSDFLQVFGENYRNETQGDSTAQAT